ncbi:MORN motif [Oxalobacteraceae bacterium]
MMQRLLLFVALLLGLSLSAFAQAQQSKLPPCPKVDYSKNTHFGVGGRTEKWHNCFGRYVAELNDAYKGDVYEGEFQNGVVHGQGRYYYLANNQSKGDVYEGQFENGLYNGQGTSYFLANNQFKGDKHVGQYKDGNKHGIGTYISARGDKYEGEYKDGTPNGHGTETQSTGDVYVGQYKDGKWQGLGTRYLLANNQFKGDKYVGEFDGNRMQGQGIYTKSDGRVFEGIWANDQFVRAEKVNLPPVQQKSDVAINEERKKLDADRQALELERQRLTEERNRREQAKQSSKLSLQTTTTNPDANGVVIISVRTNTDTSSLKINGEEQGGKSDGNYTIKKVARVGQDTNYVITAVDTNGNTDSTTIIVARQAVSPSSNQTASLKPENIKRATSRDAVAIIIGIQNYKRVPKADFANNDAKEFYEYAIRGLGIKPENIKLLVDEEADEVNIVKAFENWLPLQVNKNKTDVYVFYSGHGLPSSDGKSLYFLPHGVDKELLSRTAVGQAEVVSALVASKPKSVTMFIDACYSGQTRGGETLLASAKPIALKTDTNAFPSNFTVISASANDQISSSSPELKHGIFSFYLMKGMEGDADGNKDGKITAGEMQEYLSDKVSRQAMSMSRKQDTQLVGDANKVLMGAR